MWISKKSVLKNFRKLSKNIFKNLELWILDRFYHQRISYLIPDLCRVLPKILDKIEFESLILLKRDLQHIFNNSLNWQELRILNCKLEFEDITITWKTKSNIKTLDLVKSGTKDNSNWEEYPERFGNLMKAVSESGIKESLKEIYIDFCGVTRERVISILESLEIKNIIFHE